MRKKAAGLAAAVAWALSSETQAEEKESFAAALAAALGEAKRGPTRN